MTMLAIIGTGHPESETDHGVNNETFATLWAGDEDITDTDRFPSSGSCSVIDHILVSPL
jgi:hypothetical protein